MNGNRKNISTECKHLKVFNIVWKGQYCHYSFIMTILKTQNFLFKFIN